ncbi:hypothetical protein BDK51DRAFT_32712 [Blyttiomyces helicus]|uniref:Uncharacterized protein n=1 Tax=Blyttiomyces helicus TaxID=388810 RepID=A0A4P9VXD8_9FUNG|nr:hypothetical protein BDK51DRAFT_32712 [Blyttiomyces helicus]|eukprot:RKO83363.1 hypothetical protein BDK51DRAFT_32712 [Blyttiomyces helicus]
MPWLSAGINGSPRDLRGRLNSAWSLILRLLHWLSLGGAAWEGAGLGGHRLKRAMGLLADRSDCDDGSNDWGLADCCGARTDRVKTSLTRGQRFCEHPQMQLNSPYSGTPPPLHAVPSSLFIEKSHCLPPVILFPCARILANKPWTREEVRTNLNNDVKFHSGKEAHTANGEDLEAFKNIALGSLPETLDRDGWGEFDGCLLQFETAVHATGQEKDVEAVRVKLFYVFLLGPKDLKRIMPDQNVANMEN